MKQAITILGATGKTGRYVLEHALGQDLKIKLLVRDKAKLRTEISNRCQLIEGNATYYEDLKLATINTQAVISLIGHGKNTPPDLQSQVMRHLVKLSRVNKFERLVSLTGSGVATPEDRFSPLHRIINTTVETIDPDRIQDGKTHAQVLADSDLNWTVVRTPLQVSTNYQGQHQIGYLKINSGIWISRTNLARFILDCALSNKFNHRLPLISQWF